MIAARSGVDLAPASRQVLERIARLPYADRFDLSPFGAFEVAQLLPSGATPETVERYLERTGGNPYFLQQVISTGLTAGMPTSAVELIRSRLRDLDEDAIDLLRIAAVIGRSGSARELAESADVAASEVLGHLVTAAEFGLLEIDGSGSWAFPHDVAREAVLSTAVGHHRAALHGRVAAAMARRDPDQIGDREQYAHHCFEAAAGLPSRIAFEACSAAADEAARVLAYDRAATHRARALLVLELTAENRRRRFDTLLDLTRELRASGDVVGAAETLRTAVDVARRIGDRELVVTAVSLLGTATLWNWRQFDEVDDETVALLKELLAELGTESSDSARERAVLLGTLAVEQYYGEERNEGIRQADEAASVARTLNDPDVLGRVLNNVVIANWLPGHDAARQAALDEALDLAGHGLPTATEAIARMHRASLRLRYADIAGFERDLERAAWLVPRVSRPELDAQLTAQRAGFAILQGDFERARELSEEGLSRFAGTTLWGGEWIRLVQATSIARLTGTQAAIADELVEAAADDANSLLRRTAVLVLAESGRTGEARELQSRWNLRHLPSRDHWASQFEWVQAAETALLLGGPALSEAAERLAACSGQVIDVGTALAVWGTVDDLLARVVGALGDQEGAEEYQRRAAAVDASITAALGRSPSWVARRRG